MVIKEIRGTVEGQIEFGGRRYTVDRWIARGESSSNRRGSFHELFDKKGREFLSKQYTHEMHADCLLSDSIRFNRLAYAVTLTASFLSIERSKFRSTFPDPSLFASISGLEIYLPCIRRKSFVINGHWTPLNQIKKF